MDIRTLFGDVVSVNPNDRGSRYDERAISDRMAQLMNEALASGWERMPSGSPNWVRQTGNLSNVRNLYAEAISYLDTAPVVSKAEVIFRNDDGSRDRYMLTNDELLQVQQTGILPDAANITRTFRNATDWTTESPAQQASRGKSLALVGILAAAWLAFK